MVSKVRNLLQIMHRWDCTAKQGISLPQIIDSRLNISGLRPKTDTQSFTIHVEKEKQKMDRKNYVDAVDIGMQGKRMEDT